MGRSPLQGGRSVHVVDTLSLVTSKVDGTVVVAACGEIDIATGPELVAQVDDLVARGARSVVLDLRGVRFMDARGLGALMAADSLLREADGR
ncbi:MAG: anti-sigma factor antagonist, partial [Acidimicrobiaceae bacterium]|nr:anti-sigma factor antagonist [Acidimicrobiaceae bacterium]